MKTALVVDDSPHNRAVLTSILRKKNLNVELAEDGQKALEKFSAVRPAVVFLDYILPKRNGVEVLREIRTSDPDVVVIMVTSISSADEVHAAHAAGANGYVLKPYSPEKIYTLLEKFNLATP
jgi:CheY-like chemotaxis protein